MCQRLQLSEKFQRRSRVRAFTLSMAVGRLGARSDCPTSQRLDSGLRVVSQARHRVQRAFLLDVVLRNCSCALKQVYLSRQCLDKDLRVISVARHSGSCNATVFCARLSSRRYNHGFHRSLCLSFQGLERFWDQALHAPSSRAPSCDGQRLSPQSWR